MNPTQSLPLPDFAQAASEKRANPGVIALTLQGQLLCMNREATELCAEINQARLGRVARGVLPIEVVNLCYVIAQQIIADQDVKVWEGTHVRLAISDVAPAMLLRGYGIPGPGDGDVDQARIIIMLDRIASRAPLTMSRAYNRFGVTPRGRAVVRGLAQGLTSKEIAQQLGLTEQNIKQHVQRLMRKTKSSTRTGMLARLLLVGNVQTVQNEH